MRPEMCGKSKRLCTVLVADGCEKHPRDGRFCKYCAAPAIAQLRPGRQKICYNYSLFPLKIFEKKKKKTDSVLSFCCTCTRLKSCLPLVLWSLLLLLPSCQACLCIATHLLLLLLPFPCSTLLLHFGQKPLLCVCV